LQYFISKKCYPDFKKSTHNPKKNRSNNKVIQKNCQCFRVLPKKHIKKANHNL